MLLKSAAAWNTLGEPVTSSFLGALTRWYPTMLPCRCSSTLDQIPMENTGISILSSCSKAARSFQKASYVECLFASSAKSHGSILVGPVEGYWFSGRSSPLYQILGNLLGMPPEYAIPV